MIHSPVLYRWLLPILVSSLLTLSGFAQTVVEDGVAINWRSPGTEKLNEYESLNYLRFEGALYTSEFQSLPIYTNRYRLPGGTNSITVAVSNAVWEPLTGQEESIVEASGFDRKSLEVHKSVSFERKIPFGIVSFIPLREGQGGGYEKLVSADISITPKSTGIGQKRSSRGFVANSVLAPGSGEWYKIGVVNTGVHMVDYAFLSDMGIDVSTIDPASINVYGNGFGMLPFANWEYRPDDLLKNAIYVEGGSDGSFDQSDYILFYAKGPHVWELQGSEFARRPHLYTDTSFYFINIDPSNTPKRITVQSQSTDPVTHNVTTFNDFDYHERQEYNLVKSGRQWYGDLFDVLTERSFSFGFPNIDTATAHLKSRVLAYSPSGSSTFNISVDGNTDVVGIPSVGTSQYANKADIEVSDIFFNPTQSNFDVDLVFNKPTSSAKGWIDYLLLNVRRKLAYTGSQMAFRDVNSIGVGNVAEFRITGASGISQVWEVTNPSEVSEMDVTLSGNIMTFVVNTDSLREFVAFNGSSFLQPVSGVQIDHQNLHGLPQTDMIIVAPKVFLSQANELADFHRNEGLSVEVVLPEQVYNEFSSGMADITAIRDLMKMFYERAASDPNLMPKYLLLFGDGSYDNKNRIASNTNFLPTYQSWESLSVTGSHTTDDYYGLLDDTESIGADDLLDIGVGRLPVKKPQEASDAVNKIKHYSTNSASTNGSHCDIGQAAATLGDWRNIIAFVADDEDGAAYVNDAEGFIDTLKANHPEMNIDKIYIDAYKQQSTPGGERYPDAYTAIDQRVRKGALIMNYIGHGGEVGWAHERILDIGMIQEWTNMNNLPLFITATCEFSRFDDPGRTSAGELVFLEPQGGGIGLLTTTRLVFAGPNETLNKKFYEIALEESNGEPMALGDILAYTKNETALVTAGANFRNFTLLGDPAVKLALPTHDVVTDSINGVHISNGGDTLRALGRVTISGHIESNPGGAVMSSFNGFVFPKVYDKSANLQTLANDGGPQVNFELRKNLIYKGKVSVNNGYFEYTFVVPKDIAFQYGEGRLSYYAHDGTDDGHGWSEDVIVGGSDTTAADDDTGPTIELYLNDENFVDGGLTDETPTMLARVFDENGINTVGSGIGHDITAVIDDQTDKAIILNEFYEADLDTYQSGEVNYRLSELEEGEHTLTFKVWDVHNNSSESEIRFVVAESEELALDHVLNYPNPFTTNTTFYFEHNQVCAFLDVQVQVFTVSGRLVKTIDKRVHTDGYRIDGISWNGRDDFGDKMGRGVYVYKVKVFGPEGRKAEKFEKLVILN